jgi:Phage integrase family
VGALPWAEILRVDTKKPVNEITTIDVANILRPIWRKKPEAAKKIRLKIWRVFEHVGILLRDNYSVRLDRNPAEWRDLKALGFQKTQELSKGHYPSVYYNRMPDYISDLRTREGLASLALEFMILTVSRTQSTLEATWDQIDQSNAIWNVPIENLKDKKTRKHILRVPLSKRTLSILERVKPFRNSNYIFPGHKKDSSFSNMAFTQLMKRMHGNPHSWTDQ